MGRIGWPRAGSRRQAPQYGWLAWSAWDRATGATAWQRPGVRAGRRVQPRPADAALNQSYSTAVILGSSMLLLSYQ